MQIAIIACCKTKRPGGSTEYEPSPLADYLNASHFRHLMYARRDLAKILNLPPGPDLGSGNEESNIEFLPSFARYNGIVYQQSDFLNVYTSLKSTQVIIISALYGILDARELIRNYELNMNTTLAIRRKVKTWWKARGLGEILKEITCHDTYKTVHDLLPKSYREALKPWPPDCKNGNLIQYDYPGQGSGSIWRRSEEFQRILRN